MSKLGRDFGILVSCIGLLLLAGPANAEVDFSQPAPASRIVSLNGSITEIIYLLGKQKLLVGIDTTSAFPAETEQIQKVGYARALSAEGILALKPDLVIGTEEAGPPAVLTQLKSAGVPVKIVPSERSLRGAEDKVRAVAALLNEPQRGADLVRSMQQRADSVAPVPASTRVVFLFGLGGGTLSVAGRQTAADAMIRLSGATNAIQQYDGYKPISPEALLTASPDVILIASGTWKTIGGTEGLRKIPGVSETVAWRSNRIVEVDEFKLLGFGPRTGEAIAELRRALADAMQRAP